MRILVSGATGLIGSALGPSLAARGDRVVRLARGAAGPGEEVVRWDPDGGTIDRARVEGFDAIVHLAGRSIAGPWSRANKERMRGSRIQGTRLLCEAVAACARPPRALVCASALGYYGDRGDEILREDAPPGRGFLADLCRDWEAAARPARDAGIRVATLRIGLVLTPAGGLLARMLPLFRLGLGGRLGDGRQFMSWIGIDDLVGAILHLVDHPETDGPVNAVAPRPVTNAEFTRALGRALRRPAVLAVPRAALRVMLGEAADGMVLTSARAEPARLIASGFRFRDPELEPALRRMLRRP